MSDERETTRKGSQPPGGGPEPNGRGSAVSRRALLGGGAGVVAAGAVVAGAATDWYGTDSDPGAVSATAASENPPKAGTGSSYVPPGARTYRISVNGRKETVKATPGTMLLYVLRDQLGLRGPKFGCGLSQCGACAVLSDGKQIRSCVTSIASVGTKKITTLEGLAATYHGSTGNASLHPVQQAWIEEQVPQCGYCQDGMMIQAADLLSSNPNPSDAEIKAAMSGHLCRCGTHFRIVKAIERAAAMMAGSGGTQ